MQVDHWLVSKPFCWGFILVLFLTPDSTFAQRKKAAKGPQDNFPENPFFNGKMFFDQFFGGGRNDAERAELAKVEVSVREESEYGEQVLQSFMDDFKRRDIKVVTRGREVEYLNKLVDTLQPHMEHRDRYRSIRILFADSEITDAYSIPGGTLVIFRGMLELADSEAALVGVVGHELSHLDRRHQLVAVRRMKLARQNFSSVKSDPSAMFRQANLFMSAFMKPFHPEDELEADRDGATWAYKAGYDPRAMAALFMRLSNRDQTGQFLPAFLRTHPYHADRQIAVEQLYKELQDSNPRSDLYLGRTNLRRKIPMSEQKFPE